MIQQSASVPAGDQVEALGEPLAKRAQNLRRRRRPVGDQQQQVALRGLERLVHRRHLLGRRNLATGERQPSALDDRPDQPLGAELLGLGDQPVELGSRQLARRRRSGP